MTFSQWQLFLPGQFLFNWKMLTRASGVHRASKNEFTTSYLFEKHGTTEDSKLILNDQGDTFIINVESIRTFLDPLFLK